MYRRSDRFLYGYVRLWAYLGTRPIVGRLFGLAEPVGSRLLVGVLRRWADDLERNADEIKDLDPELSRELRVAAAEKRQQAREID